MSAGEVVAPVEVEETSRLDDRPEEATVEVTEVEGPEPSDLGPTSTPVGPLLPSGSTTVHPPGAPIRTEGDDKKGNL